MTPRPRHRFTLRSPDGIDDAVAHLQDGPLAVDTETTGLSWKRDRVGGLCLAAGDTALFAYGDALAPMIRWLAREIRHHRMLVFHHAKFDMHMLYGTFGLHIPYPVHDTMLQSHLLDNRGAPVRGSRFSPHGGHGLKRLAKVFVDPRAEESEADLMRDIRRAGGKHKGDWMLAHPRYFAKYSALDPWYTLQLHLQFMPRIRRWSQPDGYPPLKDLYENERWLTLALRDMEQRGITIDRPYLEQWRDTLETDMGVALRELNELAGTDTLNWNSTPQLRTLLFGEREHGGLNLSTDRRTKAGEISTDKTTLTRLAHPIGVALLKYRRLAKQHGTFAVGLLEAATAQDTIHCHFNQNVSTGRMSCSDPNLQQQDRSSGVRRGFVPRKGLVLRHADYSQIEMRIAAHVAREEKLIHGFNTDGDFDTHAATASAMFGVKTPTPEQRGRGKTMNFATIYGAGIDNKTENLMNQLSYADAIKSCIELGHKPSRAESPHRTLAELLTAIYNRAMPRMKAAPKELENAARERGFAMNDFGRHRYLAEDEAYTAFNTRVQGSAADAGKIGLVAMYRDLQLRDGSLAMLLQVHDEVVYETDGDPQTDQRVLECLNDYSTFKVPIVAEISGSAVSWQDKQKISFK